MQAHEFDMQINDLQFNVDRTYCITASKDKSAKVWLQQLNSLYSSNKPAHVLP